jgi:hypothetical protein
VLPDSLTLLPESFQLPRKVPRIPVPAPTPVPPIALLTITTLTLDTCPANVASGKPIEVAGKLSPAQAGLDVKVTFSFPSASPVTQVVKTDAGGGWSASYTPGPNDIGIWSTDAAFGGDSTHTASSAPRCETKYS